MMAPSHQRMPVGGATTCTGVYGSIIREMAASSEISKLHQHLQLLREQYVRLQGRHAELERRYTREVAGSSNLGPDHFVSRLVGLVNDLYDKPLYSDISVQLADRSVPAHRLVLASRSNQWCPTDEKLSNADSLDLTNLTPYVASCLLRWVYTDSLSMPSDHTAIIELLCAANKYRLSQLKEKCEQTLISTVAVHNCIRLYQTSEEHNAEQLKKYCLQIISNHWSDLNTADFAELSAPLLYDMFKAHSSYPLHLAILHQREDVVFMFIIEHNAELPGKLDECDDEGKIPLNLALLHRHEGIANTLVSHKCDLNLRDRTGNTLLHLAIGRGDSFAASFLIKSGASTILSREGNQETPLHLAAIYRQANALQLVSSTHVKEVPWPSDSMADVTQLLLEYHANPDAQDRQGYTPLMRAIETNNLATFNVLLKHPVLNLDLRNQNGDTALWLALSKLDHTYLATLEDQQDDDQLIASRLVARGSNVDAVDSKTSNSLLHQAAISSNEAAAIFLVHHSAAVNHCNQQGEAPIHIAATNGLDRLVKVLLQYGADPNLQTMLRRSSPAPPPLSATSSSHSLLGTSSPVLRPSPLLQVATEPPKQLDTGLSSQLEQLSQLAAPSLLTALSSPASQQKPVPTYNPFGSDSDEEELLSPAPTHSLYKVTPLSSPATAHRPSSTPPPPGAAARVSRQSSVSEPPGREFIAPREEFDIEHDPGKRSALHLAIAHRHSRVVDVLLAYKEGAASHGRLGIELNIGLSDGAEETPLSLSLWTNQLEIALKLLDSGADLECARRDGNTLLFYAIVREQASASLFLLNHGANFKKRTAHGETLLLLAICHQLEAVADRLCDLGAEVGVADVNGNSPLWVALRSGQESIAAKLIAHGCDPNAWHRSPDGVSLSLLHRAILLRDTPTACFLIKSGADVTSPTRPLQTQHGVFSPPLHMACVSGLDAIVTCLMSHHADVNAKDSEGQTALHVAISSMNTQCSEILLLQPSLNLSIKDKHGQTPFAACLTSRDHKTGRAILQREPKAAEEMDNRGQNFLHLAVLNQDVEAVLFLLSVHVDVNSKVQNPTMNTPLHFAVKNGSEILVRHLLLAGARVSDVDNHHRGSLHMAVESDSAEILSVLLENGADPDQTDEENNNSLHLAMQYGHLQCSQVLIEDTNINLVTVNMRGRNCLHMLAASAKDNASALFHVLKSVVPNFPINKQDADGNTALLLAYFGGNSVLCDALIQSGAHPGMCNKDSVSLFNFPVATKQLLFRILDQIQAEPAWLEGQNCMECKTKFNISTRKHHCRHCGRLLCNKCTSTQMPIVKFDLTKPVRVCEVCGDSFRLGSMR